MTDPSLHEPREGGPFGRLVMVRSGEAAPLLWSGAYFFCLLFGYYLLRPLREEMGIRGELKALPWLWTGTTAAMLVAVPLFAWLVSRTPRRRFIPIAYHFFAANILVFFGLFALLPERSLAVGYAFYIWLSVFNLFAVSIFWGFMADMFSTGQGKRLFGAIGVGGTLGAICGSAVPAALVKGVSVRGMAVQIPPIYLLLATAVFLEIGVLCVRRLTRIFGIDARARSGENTGAQREEKTAEPGRGVFNGIALVARSPYLLFMCGYMLLFTMTTTFLYFEQARIVKESFPTREAQIAFFARIDLFVNVLALPTQVFLTGRILTRLGVTAGLILLPLVTIAGFAGLAAAPTAMVLMVVQIARRGLHYAVDRPTREVLYTVLGPEEKYKSKSFIDTFVYRSGDLAGAWLDGLIVKLGGTVAAVAIGASVVWMGAGVWLGARQRRLAGEIRTPSGPR